MSRTIDISSKLVNEKSKIVIAEKEYEVNDSLDTIFKFQNLITSFTDKNKINEALVLALGKDAAKDIDIGAYNFKSTRVIIAAIMAAIMDEEVETILARFQSK